MGAAAYNRGSRRVREQIDGERRPHEFDFIEHLNAIPKNEGAGLPFGPVRFEPGNGGWWALDADHPYTKRGYLYRSLRAAVRAWRVEITEYHQNGSDGGRCYFIAMPMPPRL